MEDMHDLQSVIADTDPDSWIEALPTYQRDSILQMRARGVSYDEIAQIWIAAGSSATAPFSSGSPPNADPTFLDKLRTEVRAYLCGEKRYEKDRKQILASGKEMQTFVVGALAVAIAPYVGAASVVIAPIIALLLANIGKVSLTAWCAISDKP